jgi:hypothetical protein
MELLVKPGILTSYIYGPTFGNAESRLFLVAIYVKYNAPSIQLYLLTLTSDDNCFDLSGSSSGHH